jgi:hypothetical protein
MVVILAITTLGVADTAVASPIRECGHITFAHGSPAGIDNLTTRNVACPYARRFALQITARFPFPRHWAGFACRSYFYDHQLAFDIRCVKTAQVIHWQGGD